MSSSRTSSGGGGGATATTSTNSPNVIDEMFPEGSANNPMDLDEPIVASAISPFGMEMGIGSAATGGPLSDKILHTDYFNDFGDLYDDQDLN